MDSKLSTTEASRKLGVTSRMIRKLAEKGALPGAVKIGSVWRIPQSTIERASREGVSYQGKAA